MNIGFSPYFAANAQIYTQRINKKEPETNTTVSSIDEMYMPRNLTPKFSAVTYPQKTVKPKEPKIFNDYILGETKDEQRIIGESNVRDCLVPIKGSRTDRLADCSKNRIDLLDKNTLIINGEFNDFSQGRQGDCYLLSSIYSINNTKKGKEILKNNIQYNKDGSITVTLPGAIKAKKGYEKEGNGDKCAITGKYTITPEALKKAKTQAGKTYAYGDIEVMITELAMEAYRAEVMQTNKALNQKGYIGDIPGQCTGEKENNPLDGGYTFDATYILTGKKSELYMAPADKKIRPYVYGEFSYTEENKKLFLDTKLKANKYQKERSVTNIYDKDSDLQRMLDLYKGKEDEFAITVGVKNGKKAPDGTTKVNGGHALSVSKITDDYVEVVNPWNTTKKERIPRGIFEQMVTKFSVAQM